jgi:vitamin B12/bleomycin/antimicrobial peptide transport system ATP-binding/permease protein
MARKIRPGNSSSGAGEADPSKLLPQLRMMFAALLQSQVRTGIFLMCAGLAAVVIATALAQIALNRWNQPFYDALSHHNLGAFIDQLGVFGIIASALTLLNVGQRFLTEMLKLKLREGLAADLIGNWLAPLRAFRLANAGDIGINPDQRMHEDARHLTELSADLGTGLLQAGCLLVSFIGVLWSISSNFSFPVRGHDYHIPGYMVWAAVIYAGSASLLSYWAGRSLIARNAERYAREADMRFSLVRVNEHIDSISLEGGEADEQRRINLDLAAVLAATRRLVLGLTNLTWVTAGYGWFTLVAPILAAAPLYFLGNLSFGGLMMAAGAFTQVQTSMRWFVDNFSVIADWRATLLRVASFRQAVVTTDTLHGVESQIAIRTGDADTLRIENLEVASPAGCTLLKEKAIEIKPGDRVLIVGEQGTGKTLLFRALAGLWPWGSGTISRPHNDGMFYLPRIPYWPPGTLRRALAYPRKEEDFKNSRYEEVLKKLQLERLTPVLDRRSPWEPELNEEELTCLAFARVLLHAPKWLLIDEVLDNLDADSAQLIQGVLGKDLADSAVIHIGRPATDDHVFKRVLHLIKDPSVRRLPRKGIPSRRKPNHRQAAKSA